MSWVEKHRPRTLEDVVGNQECVARLKHLAELKQLPHLILTGPPGTGKTTSVMCLAKAVGAQWLELNASDDRGVDVVRTTIKQFVMRGTGRKFVILDEVDGMLPAAQQSIRRMLQHATFALACNNSSKIIEPLQTRCAVLRFSALGDDDVLARVTHVAREEKCETTPCGLQALVFSAQGDLRRAINALQCVHAAFARVDECNVHKIVDVPSRRVVCDILQACAKSDIDAAVGLFLPLWTGGYAAADIVSALFAACKSCALPDAQKLRFVKHIAVTHARVSQGAATQVQILGLLGNLCE